MDWAMRGHLRFFRHIRRCYHRHARRPSTIPSFAPWMANGALIGSSNWDARSFRLNFEFDLECIDRDFTAQLDAMIDAKIARGQRLDPDCLAAEPIWLRLRNAAARLLMPYLVRIGCTARNRPDRQARPAPSRCPPGRSEARPRPCAMAMPPSSGPSALATLKAE